MNCPRCGSEMVSVTLIGVLVGMRDPNWYHCHDCNHKWPVEPVLQSPPKLPPPTDTPPP